MKSFRASCLPDVLRNVRENTGAPLNRHFLMSAVNTEKPIRVGIDDRVLMHYEMCGFAR